MRDYQVLQGHDSQLLKRFFRAEDASHAAAKLAILIPLGDWAMVEGPEYHLTLYVKDLQTSEKTEHTFVAKVGVKA